MQKFISLVLFLLFVGQTDAQISVEKFSILDTDLDAKNYPVLDDEGVACALVKIITTAKGFNFEIGQLPIKKVDESRVGEIWVYVPEGTRKINISHADFGSLRGYGVEDDGYYYFTFGSLKRAKCYRMVLTHKEVYKFIEGNGETVTITFQSKVEGAEVWIGNKLAGTIQNGTFQIPWPKKLKCEYKIHKYNYEDIIGSISNTEKDVYQTVNPLPYFGILDIRTSEMAEIRINNKLEGKGHVVKELMPGRYSITISEKDKKTISKNVVIQRGKTEYVYDKPEKIYSQVNFSSNPQGCSISVDGRNIGQTPKTISVEAGDHVFKMSKFGYKTKTVSQHINPYVAETIFMTLYKPSLYKQKMFYVGCGYQIYGKPELDIKIGGYINWYNIEFGINWALSEEGLFNEGVGLQAKIGYGFVTGSRLLITPQIGYACGGYNNIEDVQGSGLGQAITLTCKFDYSPCKHITLYATPMYSLQFAEFYDEYKSLSVLKQTFNGFSIAAGAAFYF